MTISHLEQVMSTQAELTEALVEVMKHQQQAIINIDPQTLSEMVDREQELLLPIEGLEAERMRLSEEVMRELPGEAPEGAGPVSLAQILRHLNPDDAARLSHVGERLRGAVEQSVELMQANKFLIDHSRRFVRETLQMVTGGVSKQLIDQKI